MRNVLKAASVSVATILAASTAPALIAISYMPALAQSTDSTLRADLPSGQFVGADRAHQADGSARIVPLKGGGFGVKFEADFEVTGGPDLRVWISEAANPRSKSDVRAAGYIDLGRLQSSDGKQIYRLPEGFDLADANSVVIWCRLFGVFFGAAPLA
ncbi:MAG: DM13 domain-containing protein [Pacificimonas sp.]|nr:DM13 domain-containing protein [Pacificimonas sp.]